MRVLDQRSKNDRDVLYSLLFMYSFGKLCAPIFLEQNLQTFHEILCSSLFSHFILLIKRSRPTKGYHLNTLDSTQRPNATCRVSRSSLNWFWRRKFLKVFTIYECGGHFGHVIKPNRKNFCFSTPGTHDIRFQVTQQFLRKTRFKFENGVTFHKCQRITLTFGYSYSFI